MLMYSRENLRKNVHNPFGLPLQWSDINEKLFWGTLSGVFDISLSLCNPMEFS